MNVSTIIGFLIVFLSVFEVFISWELLSLTNNNYKSSFVGGVCCLLAGAVSLRVLMRDTKHSVSLVAVLSFVSAIPISVAMGSLTARYYYYPVFESCSSVGGGDFNCGKLFTGYSCYGNSRSFASSYSCLSLETSKSDSMCACVSGSGDCFVFSDIPSCSDYFYGFQRSLLSCLVLSVILFALSCVQMLMALRSLHQDNKHQHQSSGISMVEKQQLQQYANYGSGPPVSGRLFSDILHSNSAAASGGAAGINGSSRYVSFNSNSSSAAAASPVKRSGDVDDVLFGCDDDYDDDEEEEQHCNETSDLLRNTRNNDREDECTL